MEGKENLSSQILIVDLGSQYTQIIRRSLRYLGFQSIILSPEASLPWANEHKPKGIILSGGSASVYDSNSPQLSTAFFDLNIPLLGICYGMQWMAFVHDKETIQSERNAKSYGPVTVEFKKGIFSNKSKLFEELGGSIKAWSSHGDSVKKVPRGFEITATSKDGTVIEAMENTSKSLYAVQFHPEVEETEDDNNILNNFAKNICGCVKDYSTKEAVKEIQENTKQALDGGTAIIGVSGGVDSTTLAAILAPALGEKLKCFFIDTGGMRKGEIEKVKDIATKAKINLEVVDKYKNKFIEKVGQTIDAEEKRRSFREVYGEVFKELAAQYRATHMIQGTLATDLIESGSGGESALIKTHHNVDLDLGLKEIMPLSDFFKFEVRELAHEFGLDMLVAKRQPFPGPGLYLRIVGTPVTAELLETVREADAEVMEILKKHNLYDKIAQTIVALLGTKTVGVKGDGRVYGYSLVVRTVETTDFMTVKGFYLPKEVCDEIISTLSRHQNIVRVLFDWTTKPPATTEFE